ncbi:phage tail tape measure protein [Endozoicomonas ascidiicola]|uniref:phage tail tape measure protein n=1 Tax=Endozoicomonas ascidiicola TaxID=1698521 RepID=UPI00082E58CA|nr:phage tail tape measure protein [Endozoicomonas ascidiicola]
MARGLDKLMFTIGLIDKISGPVSKIQNSLGGMANKARSAFAAIAIGAAGIAGAGMALQAGLQPAIEMNRAMGEVESLGVQGDALDILKAKALDFSTQYGSSATEFVSASYDIQSAIAGLNGTELASFTEASGVLAKATKADTGTITSYMGTMYGIFKNQAAAMGNDNWVKVVAGQTASAVQMFKTTGAEMSSAFTSIGAAATSVGASMNEQMAILGTLQATMSGSEAGTKYKAFIAGIDKAQQSLGMSFTDASGNILPMMDILDKLKNQYGDTLSVAESAELAKAFGTQEAVGMIQLLMADTDGLANSIEKLGDVKGLDKASEMAGKMVDPWQRMGAGIEAVKIGIGSALLPVLEPLVTMLANGATQLTKWTQEYPEVTKWVGMAAVSVLAIGAALAALNIVMGLASLIATGWGIAMMIATSPITLIVLGIGLLIAGVVMLIKYWDELKAAFLDTAFGKHLMTVIDAVRNAIGGMMEMAGGVLSFFGMGGDETASAPKVNSLQSSRQGSVPSGGVGKSITNAISNNKANTVQIGSIQTNQPAASIEQELMMAGA